MENGNVKTQEELEMQVKILQAQMEMLKGGNTINVVQQQQQQQQQQTNTVYGEPRTQKNGTVAFLLCVFLGCFGVHKFYEGKIGTGLLYFFTFGLFGFGWLVDCFNLLSKIGKRYYVYY